MIRETSEQILNDGGHLYDLRLAKDKEESAHAWAARKLALQESVPSLRLVDGGNDDLVLELHLMSVEQSAEFDANALTEADLLRELGAIDSKKPGPMVNNKIEY